MQPKASGKKVKADASDGKKKNTTTTRGYNPKVSPRWGIGTAKRSWEAHLAEVFDSEDSTVMIGLKRKPKDQSERPKWNTIDEVAEMTAQLYAVYRDKRQSIVSRGTAGGGSPDYTGIPAADKDATAYFERVFLNLQATIEGKYKMKKKYATEQRTLTIDDMTPQIIQLWRIARRATDDGLDLGSTEIDWSDGAERSEDPMIEGLETLRIAAKSIAAVKELASDVEKMVEKCKPKSAGSVKSALEEARNLLGRVKAACGGMERGVKLVGSTLNGPSENVNGDDDDDEDAGPEDEDEEYGGDEAGGESVSGTHSTTTATEVLEQAAESTRPKRHLENEDQTGRTSKKAKKTRGTVQDAPVAPADLSKESEMSSRPAQHRSTDTAASSVSSDPQGRKHQSTSSRATPSDALSKVYAQMCGITKSDDTIGEYLKWLQSIDGLRGSVMRLGSSPKTSIERGIVYCDRMLEHIKYVSSGEGLDKMYKLVEGMKVDSDERHQVQEDLDGIKKLAGPAAGVVETERDRLRGCLDNDGSN